MKIILNRRSNKIAVFCEDTATELGYLSQDEAVDLATKLLDMAGQIKDKEDGE